jgi:hypothetical protein
LWVASATSSPLGTYAAVGQVVSVSGPDGSVPEVDVTHLGSTGKESIAGLADFGSLSFEVILDPADATTMHEQIWTDFLAGTKRNYQLRLSDSPATTVTMNGFPNQYSWNLGVDEAVRATLGIKISGAPTLLTP